jgi:hypothetical protein
MLDANDLNYLRWISQRLSVKYKESPEIILIVNNIIEKIEANISTYQHYSNFTTSSVSYCINTLKEIMVYEKNLASISKDLATKAILDKGNNTFENICITKLIK